jgi:Na+-translocating ferredoxin:NAD+ oxidoreductase RnfD subunit
VRVTFGRFIRTPKGIVLLVLGALGALGAAGEGVSQVAVGLVSATATGLLLDGAILRVWKGRWVFPSGALLTALFVAMILGPQEPWYVAVVATAVGVTSKYVLRGHTANIFNPAALALVVVFYAFGTAQSWWGALASVGPFGLVAVMASGVFITDRVNKVPLVLSFLGSYYLLFTATAFLGDPAGVAELYRAPDLNAVLFFAFFMVADPPTSPPKYREQVVYGVIAATGSYAAFELLGAAHFLLVGLIVANAWEAWRRGRARARKPAREVAVA